jgi:hypothetical protein
MNHHDAEVTDVTVVLEELDDAQTQDVVKALMLSGMTVCNVDNDKSVVEGSIESCKVRDLHKVERVRYVRSGMSYTVDYPTGDPRDKDGQLDVCDESAD